jgi:CO/xanthine dehydrogenase Mo-binding subunit
MNAPVILDRRRVLKGGGALIVSFALSDAFAQDQSAPAAPAAKPPGSLATAPYLDSWIRIDADGSITAFTGKAELGQGFKTAFQQIAAEELDVAFATLKVVTADTRLTANEGYTSGSHSMQDSGTAIQNAAAQVRELLIAEAARRLDLPPENLRTDNGAVIAPDGRRLPYGDLVAGDRLHVQAQPNSKLKDPATFKVMGQPIPRVDIPAKVTGGAAYVQDMRLPGMVHARIVRPPSYGAQLTDCDTGEIDQGDAGAVGCREMEGNAGPAETGRSVSRSHQPAIAGLDHLRATRSIRLRPKDHRSNLHPAISIARLDRTILRRCPIRRRRDDGMDPHPGCLSRPPGHRGDVARSARERPLHSRRRLRMLRA